MPESKKVRSLIIEVDPILTTVAYLLGIFTVILFKIVREWWHLKKKVKIETEQGKSWKK